MSSQQQFLKALDREYAITQRLLRAYPEDQLDLRPHPRSNSARELAWTFVMERRLGVRVWNDEFAKGLSGGSKPPAPPEQWSDLLTELDHAHAAYRKTVAAASEADLQTKVHFFVAAKTMGELTREEWVWFLLHDEIHHRGQFSVYTRMAGGKVPSIYGPSADEPWT